MLDTKYYTASVDIYDVAPESAAQHPAAATAEGVILLLSRHDVGSFDAARNALQSADTSAEIQLCVCDRAAPPAGKRPKAQTNGVIIGFLRASQVWRSTPSNRICRRWGLGVPASRCSPVGGLRRRAGVGSRAAV